MEYEPLIGYVAEMAVKSERSHLIRLILTGLAVVVGSTLASVGATHASFLLNGTINYRDAMLVALVIPLLVAPPATFYVSWLSWKLERTNAALDLLARHDPLTGLKNRRAFVEAATERLAGGAPHMLVMIDIDHFKHINDSLGHAGGDLALQHAASVIANAAPPGALVARLGGEEFGLLFATSGGTQPADASPANAEALVEAVRAQLEALPLITPAGRTRMTASFGLAPARPGEALDHMLCRADAALYAAKDAGRNRLAMAG